MAGVPTHQLASITHSADDEAFNAIADYASEFARWQGISTPLKLGLDSQDPHESDPGQCSSDSDYDSNSGYGTSESDSDHNGALLDDANDNVNVSDEAKKEQARLRKLEAAWDITKRTMRYVEQPRYSLGFGETLVLWPPPAPVSALALSEEALAKKVALRPAAKDEFILLSHFYEGDEDNPAGMAATKKTCEDRKDRGENNGKDVQSHMEIYIAQYTVGDPICTSEEMFQFKRIAVLSAAPSSALRQFGRNILKWDRLRVPHRLPRAHTSRHLRLSRFKIPSGGGDGFWEEEQDRRTRPMSSIILPTGQAESIMADIRQFVHRDTRKWYTAHGIPQRRSYLFYGPPGTGKTSMIKVIASQFRRQCCFLNMSTGRFNNQSLADALESLPSSALLVIEDVDALFTNRKSNTKNLTFSGLLNALDGVLSVDGVITVMTTNHIERLDEALLRAGRVDRRFYFGMPDKDCVERLFKLFYTDARDEDVAQFVGLVWAWKDEKVARNIATLQQLFIMKREVSAAQCAAGVTEFFETYFPRGMDIKDEILEKEEKERKEMEEQEGTSQESDDGNDGDDEEEEDNED